MNMFFVGLKRLSFCLHLHIETRDDIITLGATFIIKWANTGSYSVAFIAKFHMIGGASLRGCVFLEVGEVLQH